MKKIIEINEADVCKDYTENFIGIEQLAYKYHVGKLKIKDILKRNKIKLRTKSEAQSNHVPLVVSDYKIKKYPPKEGYTLFAIDKDTGFESKDADNLGGSLTSYIKEQYSQEIPTLYDRRMYYMQTGNYWWEQWLEFEYRRDKETKKCPYCDWETVDVNNNSGAFEMHLQKQHGISKMEYIKEHPEDKEYFTCVNLVKNRQMEDDENKFVVCRICGKKLARINNSHLAHHGITTEKYRSLYPNEKTLCKSFYNNCVTHGKLSNLNTKFHKTSQQEKEISGFIRSFGYETKSDRKILSGQEIDIFIPELNIGIEYNGNMWHTEKYGKGKHYHVSKTDRCLKKGVKLIQIFEDEYYGNKELLFEKIRHIIGKSNGEKVAGRKCIIKGIDVKTAKNFLNQYHLQGFSKSTVYLGAFYKNQLIAVMCFLNEKNGHWSLTRFATDYHYICQGVGGKVFSYFKRNFRYREIKSFADRRWTLDYEKNLYTALGFKVDAILPPDYTYYNKRVDKHKRFHKFLFRKKILERKYGFPDSMTESQMVDKLGYERIWNCGLIRYVYRNEEYVEEKEEE